MSPLSSIGLLFVGLGVLIIIFPNLLQLIVALSLMFIGVSIISMDRARSQGKSIWIFPSKRN